MVHRKLQGQGYIQRVHRIHSVQVCCGLALQRAEDAAYAHSLSNLGSELHELAKCTRASELSVRASEALP